MGAGERFAIEFDGLKNEFRHDGSAFGQNRSRSVKIRRGEMGRL
jgi:hypothetical protein